MAFQSSDETPRGGVKTLESDWDQQRRQKQRGAEGTSITQSRLPAMRESWSHGARFHGSDGAAWATCFREAHLGTESIGFSRSPNLVGHAVKSTHPRSFLRAEVIFTAEVGYLRFLTAVGLTECS